MATVRYMVRDVDRATAFYTSHLGFAVKQRWGKAIAILTHGDLELWLAGPDSSAARPMPDGAQPEPGGWNRIVIEVDNLAALHTTLTSGGATFRNHIITGPGGSQVLLEDGEGNVIELFEPGG